MLLFVVLWIGFLGCEKPTTKNKKTSDKNKPNILLVQSDTVKRGDVADYLEFTGTLESTQQANIIPEVSGTVSKVFVREGDTVKKDTILATLINPSLTAAAERSSIDLNRNRRDFSKAKELHEKGAISHREYLEAKAALKTSKTSYQEAIQNRKSTTIRSPIAGVIASVAIRTGEQAGGAQAFRVVNLEQLRLVASVPERDIQKLSISQKVLLSAAYNEKQQANGVVERIGPVVDAATGSVKVFIDLQKGQKSLKPGQFVRAQVEVDRHKDTLIIAKASLLYRDGQPIVFVVQKPPKEAPKEKQEKNTDEKDNDKEEKEAKETNDQPEFIAKQRNVTLGYSDQQHVEILKGLQVGEKVVTAGNTHLTTDAPIRLTKKTSTKDKSTDTREKSK